jgi:hypothetical protein
MLRQTDFCSANMFRSFGKFKAGIADETVIKIICCCYWASPIKYAMYRLHYYILHRMAFVSFAPSYVKLAVIRSCLKVREMWTNTTVIQSGSKL